MENATKALLIAAAVLMAILIISLGLVVYNRASEAVGTAGDLTEQQSQQRNEKFRKYEGTNLSADVANAMLQTVFNHNLAQEDKRNIVRVFYGSEGIIDYVGDTDELDTSVYPKKFSNSKRYNIKCYYGENTKKVTIIDVTPSN